MGIFRESVLATILLTVSACGGSPAEPAAPPPPPPPAAPEAPAASAAAPEAPAPVASAAPAAPEAPAHDMWKDGMTKDQEVAFMKKNVVPEMEPVFKGYNAKRYDNFSCKTCHGPKFQKPQDFLPKLVFKDGKLTAFTEHPEIAKFMAEQVEPHMATAMGLPPYDMKTNTGFGCHGCHEVKMK